MTRAAPSTSAKQALHLIDRPFSVPLKEIPCVFRQGSLRRTYTCGNAKKQRIGSVDRDSRILCNVSVTFIGPHFPSPAEKMRKPQDEELGRVAWPERAGANEVVIAHQKHQWARVIQQIARAQFFPLRKLLCNTSMPQTDRVCEIRNMAKNTISNARTTATYSLQP